MSIEEIGFKRLYTIKDLFNPINFLNNFQIIEFESVKTFMRALDNKFIRVIGDIWIHITTPLEFDVIKKLFVNTPLTEYANFILEIDNHIIDYLDMFDGLDNIKFVLILNKDTIEEQLNYDNEKLKLFRQNHEISIKYRVSFTNINTIFDEMIGNYQKHGFRYIYLEFDYESFQEATLHDLDNIRFRINRLNSFRLEVFNKGINQFKIYLFNNSNFVKRIFVDTEFNLWYTRQHYLENKNNEVIKKLFTLDTFHTNGEEIPAKIINYVRQYIDLPPEAIVTTIPINKNFMYIDFYQNVKIMRFANEMPYITQLILNWLDR